MQEMSSDMAQTRAYLKTLAENIPPGLRETDKQMFIDEEILRTLTFQDRLRLRRFVNVFLLQMRKYGASDIELGAYGSRGNMWLRNEGRKVPVEQFGVYSEDEFNILILSLLQDRQRKILFENRSIDFSYTIRQKDNSIMRYRASAYFELGELALNMRAISDVIRPFESYQFHENIRRILSLTHTKAGIVLVTGITGSGKSTTLDAIIDMNNRSIEGHVVIIASPVEYVHMSNHCIVRHREVGTDTVSFKSGTIEALRQDPDVIMIGEMRDPDTIMAALEAADTGHKIFSTMHTSSASESIDRIIGEVPPLEQERVRMRLGDTLSCVISQKLVPDAEDKRVLAKEVLLVNSSVKSAIKSNNLSEIYQMISEGGRLGMCTMEQDLYSLYRRRIITRETAHNYANNKRRMKQLFEGI